MVSFMLYFGLGLAKNSIVDNTAVLMKDKMANIMNQVDSLLAGYLTQINIISTDQIILNGLSDSDGINKEEARLIDYRLSTLLIYSGPWDSLLIVDDKGKSISAASVRSGNKIFEMYAEESALLGRANSEHITYSNSYIINNEIIFSSVATIQSVVDGREKVVGYIIGRVAIRSLQDILSNSSDNIALFRDDGVLIAKNVTDNQGLNISNEDISNFSEKTSAYLRTVSGIDYMITLVRENGVAGYKGNKWILASVSDVSIYIKENQKGINRIIYIATAAMFLLLGMVILVLRRFVSTPVKKLQFAANAIASGDFEQSININSRDEIGDLGVAFSKMAGQLSGLYNSLEERVKNKTSELENRIGELASSKLATENALNEIKNAEDKMLEKNIQVENAFDEVQHFARMADRERLTYSLLISSIGEGVVVIDPKGIISVTNNVCAKMFGKNIDELKGLIIFDILELYSNDKKLVDVEYLRNILVEGNLHNFRYWVIKRKSDGQEIIISGVIAPLIDESSGGIARGMIFTLRNVVEEKLLEEARVGFISTASHQLRTPLTSMRWFVEMLHDGDAGDINEEQQQFLERVSEGIDRMIGLVNMLLQIARIEAGRTNIEPVPVDFVEVANSVAKTIELQLKEHGQQIVVIKDSENIPLVMLDKDYVWQVVQNLFTNAQRYSFDNTTTEVHIKVDGEVVVFSVLDHGIGIPKVAQIRVFEKFYRADNALTKVPSGTGLGLSLVKMLVEEMGGVLTFESEENIGTTFIMKIPISGMKARAGDVKLTV